jgi:tetratricopeptide (TPR) repeat protein
VLAENAPSRKKALEYYEKGVAAGERAIGPETFQESVGHFWGLLETRPYMRAREGLAHTLWTLGRREEAVSHLQDVIRLNPNDNQGVRYTLASWLLSLDRDRDLAQLLAQYTEDTAAWVYSKALLAFREQGDTPESRRLLEAARRRNKFVPKYLLGEEPIPSAMPDHYGIGDRNEAIIYVAHALIAWRSRPEALTWAREVFSKPRRQPGPEELPLGPSALNKHRLRRLPQVDDVWQAGLRRLPQWVKARGRRVMPWVALDASRTSG